MSKNYPAAAESFVFWKWQPNCLINILRMRSLKEFYTVLTGKDSGQCCVKTLATLQWKGEVSQFHYEGQTDHMDLSQKMTKWQSIFVAQSEHNFDNLMWLNFQDGWSFQENVFIALPPSFFHLLAELHVASLTLMVGWGGFTPSLTGHSTIWL